MLRSKRLVSCLFSVDSGSLVDMLDTVPDMEDEIHGILCKFYIVKVLNHRNDRHAKSFRRRLKRQQILSRLKNL
jgi:hypothetical protein